MFYTFHEIYWKRRNLPPGPYPWLLAGNMPQVLLHPNNLDQLFLKWKQKYGGVFTFWMGPYPIVMVGDVDKMKLYFVRHADVFTGSGELVELVVIQNCLGGHNGIVQVQGEKWREQRRFTLHTLRDFGLGRSSMQHNILTQVDSLIHHFQSQIPNQSSIEDDASFVQLQAMLGQQSSLVTRPIMGLYLTLPITVHIPWLNSSWLKLIQIRDNLWDFLERQIQEHKVAFHSTQPATDFTFAYLLEMHKRKHDSQEDMDIQHKCQIELDGVDGCRVELRHRPRLNYLQATLLEIQRVANILPINLLRTCTQSIQLDGYHYPKDTMVLPQVSIAMNDPSNFNRPHLFQPERFLNVKTNSLNKPEAFLPFSLGKRQCLGESLAKAELFLILANLLKQFEFELDVESRGRPLSKDNMVLRCHQNHSIVW
uniref:Cytochrome P450 n=1 Tax=Ditylenchus dipsaci TaxID=166011 RepID=A0A915D4W1_9BILA